MNYKIGDKVLVFAIIEQIVESKSGFYYSVKPDDKKEWGSASMLVPEDCITASTEILEEKELK